MSRWIAAILISMALACGQKGEPDAPILPPDPLNTPTPDPIQPANLTSVRMGLITNSISEDVKCTGVRPGLRLSDAKFSSGNPEWNEKMVIKSTLRSRTERIKQLLLNFDEGRFFYGNITFGERSTHPSSQSVILSLGIIDAAAESAQIVSKRKFIIRNDQISSVDLNGVEVPVSGGRANWNDRQLTYALPSQFVEGVVLYPLWFYEVMILENTNLIERSGIRIIKSPRNQSLDYELSECTPNQSSEDHPIFQLVHKSEVGLDEIKQVLGLARHSWIATNALSRRTSPVVDSFPLLFAPKNSADHNLKQLPRTISENDLLFATIRDYSSIDRLVPRWRYNEMYRLFSEYFSQLHYQVSSDNSVETVIPSIVIAHALAVHNLQRAVGLDFSSYFVPTLLDDFLIAPDVEGERLNLEVIEKETLFSDSRAIAKVFSVGELMGSIFDSEKINEIAQNYFDQSPESRDIQTFRNLMTKELVSMGFSRDFLNGWFGAGEYHNLSQPKMLLDADGDALIGFAELRARTSLTDLDTDGDGWSDTSELLAGHDPRIATDHPDVLFADGSFGDWRHLLPNRVMIDRDTASSACNGNGDITHHAAIFDQNKTMIMANTQPHASETAFKWHVFLELALSDRSLVFEFDQIKGERKWTITMPSNKKFAVDLLNTASISAKTLESEIRFREIVSESDLENLKDLRFRVQTLNMNNEICDDTQWVPGLKSRD